MFHVLKKKTLSLLVGGMVSGLLVASNSFAIDPSNKKGQDPNQAPHKSEPGQPGQQNIKPGQPGLKPGSYQGVRVRQGLRPKYCLEEHKLLGQTHKEMGACMMRLRSEAFKSESGQASVDCSAEHKKIVEGISKVAACVYKARQEAKSQGVAPPQEAEKAAEAASEPAEKPVAPPSS